MMMIIMTDRSRVARSTGSFGVGVPPYLPVYLKAKEDPSFKTLFFENN
jgi:hypothetical protein